VPYWVDDESVRASMAASGPSPPRSIEGCAPDCNWEQDVIHTEQPACSPGALHLLLQPHFLYECGIAWCKSDVCCCPGPQSTG
jgi:hypothetical protein